MGKYDNNFEDTLLYLLKSKYDKNPTTNEAYARQLISNHLEVTSRNEKLTQLIDGYVIQQKTRLKTNNRLKKVLFWFFLAMLSVLTIGIILVFSIFLHYSSKTSFADTNVGTGISMLTIAATYLTSLLAIFNIMSTYLFPIDEEKDTIEMIKTVINNDVKVEKVVSGRINENKHSPIDSLKEIAVLHKEGSINDIEFDDLKKDLLARIKSSDFM